MATLLDAIGGMLGGMAQVPIATTQFIGQGGTTMAYTPAQTWNAWNNLVYTGTNVTNAQVWQQWNNQTIGWINNQTYEATPEQIDASREALKKLQAARERAEEFLLENLSPEQRESYKKNKMFVVETPKKNRYVLHAAQLPRRLVGDRPVTQFCIHTHGVPREDELLGFKLLLEANEEEFLKTANATALAA